MPPNDSGHALDREPLERRLEAVEHAFADDEPLERADLGRWVVKNRAGAHHVL